MCCCYSPSQGPKLAAAYGELQRRITAFEVERNKVSLDGHKQFIAGASMNN